jgi:poly(hydroxyalkanoate) granule-associated protein
LGLPFVDLKLSACYIGDNAARHFLLFVTGADYYLGSEIMEENSGNGAESRESGNLMLASLQRVLLAGVGVVVLAQEEIEEFVRRLVDRGDIAEDEGRALVEDVLEQRDQRVQNLRTGVGGTIDRGTGEVYRRLNIPTRSEIVTLSEQIEALSRKVDELVESSQE